MNSLSLTSHLRNSFEKMGARVKALTVPDPRSRRASRERIRIREGGFELLFPPGAQAYVLDCHKEDRHLLLLFREIGAAPQRFLCGHDERDWFAASVSGSTVQAAKESLIPIEVRSAIARAGLRHRERFRRRTAAFRRQGEWFFVPVDAEPNPLMIHRREPLIRPGGGKPHLVDEIVRGGGEMVWFHPQHASDGVREEVFRAMSEAVRKSSGWQRRMRFQGQGLILARGAVRHPDHETIQLHDWHQVFLNSEQRPASLGFFD